MKYAVAWSVCRDGGTHLRVSKQLSCFVQALLEAKYCLCFYGGGASRGSGHVKTGGSSFSNFDDVKIAVGESHRSMEWIIMHEPRDTVKRSLDHRHLARGTGCVINTFSFRLKGRQSRGWGRHGGLPVARRWCHSNGLWHSASSQCHRVSIWMVGGNRYVLNVVQFK